MRIPEWFGRYLGKTRGWAKWSPVSAEELWVIYQKGKRDGRKAEKKRHTVQGIVRQVEAISRKSKKMNDLCFGDALEKYVIGMAWAPDITEPLMDAMRKNAKRRKK